MLFGVSDGRLVAQRVVDLGWCVRFYFIGDGQFVGGDGGIDWYIGGNVLGNDQFYLVK